MGGSILLITHINVRREEALDVFRWSLNNIVRLPFCDDLHEFFVNGNQFLVYWNDFGQFLSKFGQFTSFLKIYKNVLKETQVFNE